MKKEPYGPCDRWSLDFPGGHYIVDTIDGDVVDARAIMLDGSGKDRPLTVFRDGKLILKTIEEGQHEIGSGNYREPEVK